MESRNGGLTIQAFAKVSGLTAHTLRYYERIGLIDPVERAGSGHRRYSEEDRHWVEFLHKLRSTGMSIREMRTYAELQRQGDATLAPRVRMLEALRDQVVARVAELEENLELIRFKIRVYGRQLREPRAAPGPGERDVPWARAPCLAARTGAGAARPRAGVGRAGSRNDKERRGAWPSRRGGS